MQGPYSDQTIHPFTRSRNALLILQNLKKIELSPQNSVLCSVR